MMITIFRLLTHDAPNAYHNVVMFQLLLHTEPNTSFLVHLMCINEENVLKHRQLYWTKNVLYHAHETTRCHQPNGPSLPAFATYLADTMDKPYHVLRFTPQLESKSDNLRFTPQLESKSNNLYLFFWLNQLWSNPIHLFDHHNSHLFHHVHATSENSYPLNVVNTFFLVYSGIPKCYPALRFFDGLIFGYFYNILSSQRCIESIPAVWYFLFTVIFFAVPSTTMSSLRPLFYNLFISIKFKGLGGATKTFAPTIMTTGNTTTERTTISLTTEIDVHIRQWKVHKKTKDNTQNPSVCFPAFLFGQITMLCLRGCMIEQCIWHSTTRAHTDYGFGYFSNQSLSVILSRIKGVCCLENNSIGQGHNAPKHS